MEHKISPKVQVGTLSDREGISRNKLNINTCKHDDVKQNKRQPQTRTVPIVYLKRHPTRPSKRRMGGTDVYA